MNEETLRSLTRARESGDDPGGSGRKVSDVVSYRHVGEIPPLRDFQIQVWPRASLPGPAWLMPCEYGGG